ncbi:MAG: nucleotidyltransferase family protein [Deltaproteobacteria bacterium]|nr:nucleotidyltransferase family protein [Nannocystaceae bacterium]
MKALVLCAGAGTRLGALCDKRPKPLITVGSRAIVEHILASLVAAGCDEVWINLHHHAEQFPATLGTGARFGLRIHYVWEPQTRGTAGTVADLRARVGDELLVHYGDILTDHDLGGLLDAHRRRQSWATLLVHQRSGSNSVALLGDDDRVLAFHERPQHPVEHGACSAWVFSGICVLGRSAMAAIPGDACPDLPRDLFPALAAAGRLHAQRLAGFRCAIDSPERLALARSSFVPRP